MGMAELIDRNAFCDFWRKNYRHQYANDTFLFAIANFPTTDAVPVVRCKDCKHWHDETGWCYHHSHFVDSKGGFCHPWESNDWKMLNEDDFCSYGERKDND